jgi:hypothetical protein
VNRPACVIFSFLLLGGCSSIAVTKPLGANGDNAVTIDYCVESNAKMNIIDKSLTGEQNRAHFNSSIEKAIDDIDNYIEANTVTSPRLKLVKRAACNEALPPGGASSDLNLTVDLSGYGSIKPEWKDVLIGTGAVEAVAQGVVVGAATQNPWIGAAVSTEEMTSEYLTWNGVDWLLGETYAPVTLEGELTYDKNKKVIWRDSNFVTENDHELAKLSSTEKKDKSRQLKASLHKAESKLFSEFNSYLSKQIL